MLELLPFEEVYRRHADDVFRFCLFQLRDVAAAEDVAADTFVSAFAEYERISPPEDKVRVWLIRIARNDVIDHKRRAQRWRLVMIKLQRERHIAVSEVDGLAGTSEDLAEVLEAMRDLSERDRLLVSLRCAADLSFDEVGKVAGMSTKNATTATRRALERLRSKEGIAHARR